MVRWTAVAMVASMAYMSVVQWVSLKAAGSGHSKADPTALPRVVHWVLQMAAKKGVQRAASTVDWMAARKAEQWVGTMADELVLLMVGSMGQQKVEHLALPKVAMMVTLKAAC